MNRRVVAGLIALLVLGALLFASYFLRPHFRARKINQMQKNAEEKIKAGEYLDAELILRKALKIEPDNSEINFKLGQVLEKQGILNEAQEYYFKSAKNAKSPEPAYSAAITAYKMGKIDEAEKLFQAVVANYPNDIPSLYQLGWLLARKGDYANAVTYFERIVGIKPDEAEAYNNLGYCLYNMDQPERAKDMFKRALELNPELESAKKSLKTIEEELSSQK